VASDTLRDYDHRCRDRRSRLASWQQSSFLVLSPTVVDINVIYQEGRIMSETGTAKLFMHGRSQAVRLPKAFRLPGTEVRVRRVGRGVLLEPVVTDEDRFKAIFAELDRYRDIPSWKRVVNSRRCPKTTYRSTCSTNDLRRYEHRHHLSQS
jgi:antitoxin VapB